MHHLDRPGRLRCELVGDGAGAVGRVVVHHEQVEVRQTQAGEPLRHERQVLALVESGNDDDDLRW